MSSDQRVTAVVERAWCDVLGVGVVRTDDGFFAVGGDSMRALSFVTLVQAALDIPFPLEVLLLDGTFGSVVAACRASVDELVAGSAPNRGGS